MNKRPLETDMNNDDFKEKLTELVGTRVDTPSGEEVSRIEDMPDAPFNNFFGDDFLTLLFRSKTPCAYGLARVKEHLETVSDLNQPRHMRAHAAVALGRFVQKRPPDAGSYLVGSSTAQQWFHLSRQLNSVVGSLALANALLQERDQRIDFDLDTDPLPRLVHLRERPSRATPGVDSEVAEAWYLGARVAVRHVQRDFSGWDQESYHCALACIVNYLTILPATGMVARCADVVAQRRHALGWIKPLWNRLIPGASRLALVPDAYQAALVEQQLAIFLRLDDLEENPELMRENANSTGRAAKPGPNQLVVVRGVIPSSSDRAESDYLKQFEALRKPLTFRTLPSLDDLYGLRNTLSAEFPWADEAISLVLSDLIARRRHGVVRLGMAPILLVGSPGTGKTRFAQRLSDLLNTPSTVINLAGMTDVKLLKGVTRGWASNRPSRLVEFILQTKAPNPLFILDEIDKAHASSGNGGDPQAALLDLLEPGNAQRYQDIYLMAECDLSHCLYIATSNSLADLPAALLSRLRPVLFPAPGPEDTPVILNGIMRDMERAWSLPEGALTLTPRQAALLHGLSPREMRRALLEILGRDTEDAVYTQH